MRGHFLIFATLIIFWSLSLYFYNIYSSWEWLQITIALTIITVFELFCFIIAISDSSLKKFKTPLIISAILGLAIVLAVFISEGFKNYLIGLSPHSATFLLILFIYTTLGLAILFEKSLKSSRFGHLRAIYILVNFGVFIMVITVLYIFFPPISGEKGYFWLGPVFAFLFLLSSLIGYYLTKEIETRSKAERLAEEWEKLAQAKDQFILSIQHHLRTPLFPLRGYLERILEGSYGREENPVIKEKLFEMKKLADTLYFLIENLLDIQELRIGKKTLNLESCQIENLIESVIEEVKPEAEQKGLYLRFEPSPKISGEIKLDKKKIRTAIWNLIDNAIKYTNRGGVTIKSQITDDKLKIEVSDTGIGMEKKEIDYFLEGKFFERGEEAKELYGPGRGIGLAIAVEFIKAHGGKIWAESKGWGRGTTFWIELPLRITNKNELPI